MKGLLARLLGVFAAGLLASVPASSSETITYTYDALGRLVTVSTTGTAPSNGQNVSTTFDPAGNRTNYTVSGVGGGGGGTPTVSINSVSATEGAGASLSFTVSLSAASSGTVTVNYATQNNTAVAGSDYTAITATPLTFSAGQTSKTVTVSLINDTVSESQETMFVNLTSPSGAILGTAQGTGTINDDDSGGGGGSCTPIIPPSGSYTASSSYSASYTGLSGTGAGMRDSVYNTAASIHGTNAAGNEWIRMDLGSSQTVGTVVVVPAAASAPGGWGATYLNGATLQRSTNGTTWTAVGSAISGAVEGTRTYIPVNTSTRYLRLLKPTSWLGVGDFFASASTCSGGGGGSTANLAIGNASVTEGGTLAFTVTRSGTTSNAVSASYNAASGSAIVGSDFNAASGTVSFAANVTTATINVTTIDDAAVESAETMTVNLSSPSSGAAITGATGTGTINDNDSAATPTVSIANTTNGSEPGTNGTLTVTQSATSASATTVSLSYSGTASNGADYSAPTSVTIPAGSISAQVTLSVIDDTAVEGSESATVTLSSVTTGTATIGSPNSATNTIADNDTAPTQIVLTDSGFNVLPAHQSTYTCADINIPEYNVSYQYCYVNAGQFTVFESSYWAPGAFDPGYSMPTIPVLQVQSNYYGTGVAP